jgi:hypothetical protein
MAGALIIAAGMAGLIVSVHHYGAAVTTWELTPGLLAAGLGLGTVLAPLADIVLDRVPRQDAGSASGVFNTGLQVGNSIGIAVIGVIFFGLLGTQAGPAATAVAPQLRTGLVAAGVPAQYTGGIESQFRSCLHDRLVSADPTVTPPSCRPSAAEQALPAAAHQAIAGAGGSAVRDDFAASLQRTLWFQVGAFLASLLLMLALPRGAGRRTAEAAIPRDSRGTAPLPAGQTGRPEGIVTS